MKKSKFVGYIIESSDENSARALTELSQSFQTFRVVLFKPSQENTSDAEYQQIKKTDTNDCITLFNIVTALHRSINE